MLYVKSFIIKIYKVKTVSATKHQLCACNLVKIVEFINIALNIVKRTVNERITFTRQMACMYKGRSIDKLQNDIILLIFTIRKFGNMHFVGNLIGDILEFL